MRETIARRVRWIMTPWLYESLNIPTYILGRVHSEIYIGISIRLLRRRQLLVETRTLSYLHNEIPENSVSIKEVICINVNACSQKMHPTQLASSDVWGIIYPLLSTRDLFSLWKSHPYFTHSLLKLLRQKKRDEYGIDLVSSVRRDSLLTTYYIMQKQNNILTDGIYHLRSDVICKTLTDFFILRGRVTFYQESTIVIFRGNFFRLENCQFSGSHYTVYFPHGGNSIHIENSECSIHIEDFETKLTLSPSCIKSDCKFITATPECLAGLYVTKCRRSIYLAKFRFEEFPITKSL